MKEVRKGEEDSYVGYGVRVVIKGGDLNGNSPRP